MPFQPPPPSPHVHVAMFNIDVLLRGMDEPRPRDAVLYQPDQEWLLGTVIPPFQRPLVWDEGRMARFVESAWMGFSLGQYIVNDTMNKPLDERGRYHRTDRWLVDGQQRLTALKRYFADDFPVFGGLWSEVPARERRRFLNTPFPRGIVSIADEGQLRELYDRLNFGGVPHLESQRALSPESPAPFGRGP